MNKKEEEIEKLLSQSNVYTNAAQSPAQAVTKIERYIDMGILSILQQEMNHLSNSPFDGFKSEYELFERLRVCVASEITEGWNNLKTNFYFIRHRFLLSALTVIEARAFVLSDLSEDNIASLSERVAYCEVLFSPTYSKHLRTYTEFIKSEKREFEDIIEKIEDDEWKFSFSIFEEIEDLREKYLDEPPKKKQRKD